MLYHVFTVDDEVKDRNDEDSLITTSLQEVIDAWVSSRADHWSGGEYPGDFSVHLEIVEEGTSEAVYSCDLKLR